MGSDFHVHVGAMQTATVRLVSVTDLPQPPGSPAPAPEGFSLRFTGAAKQGFPQGSGLEQVLDRWRRRRTPRAG